MPSVVKPRASGRVMVSRDEPMDRTNRRQPRGAEAVGVGLGQA